jgi:choline dehydrogenase-like flavoprotein
MANGSGVVGNYLMDHLAVSHTGMFVDDTDRYYQGERPNNLYIARFRNLAGRDEDANFLRGYGYQCIPLRPDWETSFNRRGFGEDYKAQLGKPLPLWVWAMRAFIECLPNERNRIYLHPTKTDRFGIPLLVTEFEWSDNERNAALDSGVQAAKILRAAGAISLDIDDTKKLDVGGDAIHEMGTVRMGKDPAASSLNGYNQAHEVDNLFVTDGSFMTSSSCVNPSLTYMAFTARACDYAVARLQEGQLG